MCTNTCTNCLQKNATKYIYNETHDYICTQKYLYNKLLVQKNLIYIIMYNNLNKNIKKLYNKYKFKFFVNYLFLKIYFVDKYNNVFNRSHISK